MPLRIPLTSGASHYEFVTTLSGTSYVFSVRWNERTASWYLDILTEQDEALCTGVRMVLGTLLCARSPDPRLPPGQLMMVDLTDQGIEAGFDDLGERVVLLYYDD